MGRRVSAGAGGPWWGSLDCGGGDPSLKVSRVRRWVWGRTRSANRGWRSSRSTRTRSSPLGGRLRRFRARLKTWCSISGSAGRSSESRTIRVSPTMVMATARSASRMISWIGLAADRDPAKRGSARLAEALSGGDSACMAKPAATRHAGGSKSLCAHRATASYDSRSP